MNKNKLLILLLLRILLCALFVFSGFSKLYPTIFGFEKQLVDLGFASWCNVAYLSRALIAVELFLGFAFLQSNYLKRFVIPATFILLVIFCVHLTIEIFTKGASEGNCGCFGELIPMTPLQALLKNLVTLGILGYMYSIYKEKEKNQHLVLLSLYLATNLAIFVLYPFTPCKDVKPVDADVVVPIPAPDTTMVANDTSKAPLNVPVVVVPKPATITPKDTTNKVPVVLPKPVPAKKTSEFTAFKKFSDGSVLDLDDGKKIVTLFSLECEHCMETAKKIGELSRAKTIPGVYILFWGSEDQVENFFKVAQCRFPYKIVEPEIFFPLLGKAPAPPRVVYMHNGNILGDWDFNSFAIEKLDQKISE